MQEAAPAKINLYLHVTGRRADGYHLLDSLVLFAGAHDIVHAAPAASLSLEISGPFATGLTAEPDNLVLRAACLLAEEAGVPAHAALHLQKHLPIASGIGGGSSDAAATLRVLSRLWDVTLPDATMARIALSLGADVPVCLTPAAWHMSGVGEILSAAPSIPECGLVLVNPGVPVSTADVFRARQGGFSPAAQLAAEMPRAWDGAQSFVRQLAGYRNDLEAPAITLCPPIGEALAALHRQGCLLARMSGSGGTCFALTENPASAARLARAVSRPGWWCWGGGLFQPGQVLG